MVVVVVVLGEGNMCVVMWLLICTGVSGGMCSLVLIAGQCGSRLQDQTRSGRSHVEVGYLREDGTLEGALDGGPLDTRVVCVLWLRLESRVLPPELELPES